MTGNEPAATPTANVEAVAPIVPAAEVADPNTTPSEGVGGDQAVVPVSDTPVDPVADPAAGEAVPENYEDFTVPEGLVLDPESTSAFKELAKSSGLSQAKAQQAVDLASGLVQKTLAQFQEQHTERVTQWAEQVKTDPVVGGPKYSENVQVALEGVAKFGDPELTQAFEEFGLGNHPAFVRAFFRIGQAMRESGSVHGMGQESPAKPINREAALAQRISDEQARNPAGRGPRK